MNSLIQLKTLGSRGRNPARSLPLRRGFLLIRLILVCFAFAPQMRAASCHQVINGGGNLAPPPHGGYCNFTTAEGTSALFHLNDGLGNTALGWFSLFNNTTASFNTGVGAGTLMGNNADQNTAVGAGALLTNTEGSNNVAVGSQALFSNTLGHDNTAVGSEALFHNIGDQVQELGSSNSALGHQALFGNTIGHHNTGVGDGALSTNEQGVRNTAIGANALAQGSGNQNTAIGDEALVLNASGSDNTAIGQAALANNPTGSQNIALGRGAGANLSTGDNNIDIGNFGVNGDANTIRVGDDTHMRTFIAGIRAVPVTGTGVVVASDGQLGVAPSTQQFKDDIKPMDKASEAILALKPVTFHYKKEVDPHGIPQFGLVAEEVEKVNPDLVACDRKGKPYTVRYDAVNAMLLNEFLKEHKKTEKLEATVASLIATVKEQAAQIQKVSAQLEASKTAPQVVNNP